MEQEVYSIVCGKQSNYKPELKKERCFGFGIYLDK